jgi:hypothetical protein
MPKKFLYKVTLVYSRNNPNDPHTAQTKKKIFTNISRYNYGETALEIANIDGAIFVIPYYNALYIKLVKIGLTARKGE